MVSIAPTKVTTTKAGSSAQKSTSGVTSNPGHERKGTPTHCALSIACTIEQAEWSTDTAQPTAIPMTGDHSRNAGGARSTRDPTTTMRCQGRSRSSRLRRAVRHVRQGVEYDRHDRCRYQHDYRAGNHRCEYPTQQRETGSHGELEQRRHDDEARHSRRTALHQGRHAYRDESPRRAHDEHVSGTKSPDPDGLEDGRGPADYQRREDSPRYVGVRLLCNPRHDDNGQDHRRQLPQRSEGSRSVRSERSRFRVREP